MTKSSTKPTPQGKATLTLLPSVESALLMPNYYVFLVRS